VGIEQSRAWKCDRCGKAVTVPTTPGQEFADITRDWTNMLVTFPNSEKLVYELMMCDNCTLTVQDFVSGGPGRVEREMAHLRSANNALTALIDTLTKEEHDFVRAHDERMATLRRSQAETMQKIQQILDRVRAQAPQPEEGGDGDAQEGAD
jgi:hypothetical protein